MNTFSKTIWPIFAVAILAITVSSTATARGHQNREEVRQAMQEFYSQEILPVMNEWKTKIDGALSQEDLATLNGMREQAASLQAQRKQQRDALKAQIERIKQDYDKQEAKEKIRELIKETRSQNQDKALMKTIMTDLKALLQNYTDLVQDISEEAKTKQEAWKAGKEEIKKQFQTQDSTNKKHHRKGRRAHRANKTGERNGKFAIARIFLWNGENQLIEATQQTLDVSGFGNSSTPETSPNPFSEGTTIYFNLDSPGTVVVNVFNQSGKLIETLHNGHLGSGEHRFDFDGSKYTSGIYIYEIRTDSGNKAGQMILKK